MVVMKSYKNAATELDLSLATMMVQRPLEMNRLYKLTIGKLIRRFVPDSFEGIQPVSLLWVMTSRAELQHRRASERADILMRIICSELKYFGQYK